MLLMGEVMALTVMETGNRTTLFHYHGHIPVFTWAA